MDSFSSIVDNPVFLAGLALVCLFMIPFLYNTWTGWQGKRDAVNSPMKVTLSTDKTPANVNAAARAAKQKMFLVGLGVFVLFMAVLHVVNIELAKSVDNLLVHGAIAVMDLLASGFAAVSDLLEGIS